MTLIIQYGGASSRVLMMCADSLPVAYWDTSMKKDIISAIRPPLLLLLLQVYHEIKASLQTSTQINLRCSPVSLKPNTPQNGAAV